MWQREKGEGEYGTLWRTRKNMVPAHCRVKDGTYYEKQKKKRSTVKKKKKKGHLTALAKYKESARKAPTNFSIPKSILRDLIPSD